MLKKCPECDLQVSDKALTCPHCGFPLKSENITYKRSSKRRRRLPNGFGRITELKSKALRKPFRAMVSDGKDKNGHPVGKLLKPEAYFATYNEAYEALLEYHRNPCDLSIAGMTVEQLYEQWSEWYFKKMKSQSSIRTITAVWAYCQDVKNMKVKDVRARHVKHCMDDGYVIVKCGVNKGAKRFATPNTKARIKSFWNIMLDYALEYELVDRNYARTFDISSEIIDEKEQSKRGHMSFTDEEMNVLWDNKEYPWVNVVLIQCYTGWRPQELGLIRVQDVDLNNWVMKGGMKTTSGMNRIVPIHTVIRPFIVQLVKEANDRENVFLISCEGGTHKENKIFTYDKYRDRFNKIKEVFNLHPDHRPHDGRKEFVTLAKRYGVDEYAIKRIIGHTVGDLTEEVYTDRDANWLSNEIEKIKGPRY